MNKLTYFFYFVAFLVLASSIPVEEYLPDEEEVEFYRSKRSLQPGAPQFPSGVQNKNGGWSVNPNIEKDPNGNTRTSVEIKQKGQNHDFNAGWSKVVRGPAKSKPTFHVGGSYRWRRSVQPDAAAEEYVYNPEDLNTVYLSDEENVDFNRQTRSLQPGAPQFPSGVQNQNGGWSVSPNIEKDPNENTRTSVEIQQKGQSHDFNAGWSKVVRGPAKSKPTFHVGGSYRWRRSLPPGAVAEEYTYDPENLHTIYSPYEEEIDFYRPKRSLQPGAPQFPGPSSHNRGWSVSPNVEKDPNGNTRTSVEIQQKGQNHNFNAGWSKVVRGPAKAKPTFHVGGTYRWRRSVQPDTAAEEYVYNPEDLNTEEDDGFYRQKRSLQPGVPQFPSGVQNKNGGWSVSPNIEKNPNGNTRTSVEIQQKGQNHDFNAGWSKVVRGPAKAKPIFHIGGSYRW